MTLTLYKMTSTKNSINKQKTKIKELTCHIYDNCNILNPSFVIKYDDDILNCNYAYCDKLKRFYFINNIVVSEGNKLVASCSVDVLDTYWNQIKNTKQHVVRNQHRYNLYLRDSSMVITSRPKRQTMSIERAYPYPLLTSPSDTHYNILRR